MSNKESKSKKPPEDDSKKQDAIDHYNDLVAIFMTGVILPVLLGVFTIPALMIAAAANDQSQIANQISLMSLCTVVNETDGPCADILAQTDALLPVLANAAFSIPSSSGRITVVPSVWGQSTVGPVTYVLYVGCGFTLVLTVVLLVVRGWGLRRSKLRQQKTEKRQQKRHRKPAGFFSTFSINTPGGSARKDLRRERGRNRRRIICIPCHQSKLKCDEGQPCSRCKQSGSECIYQQALGQRQEPGAEREGTPRSEAQVTRQPTPESPRSEKSPLGRCHELDEYRWRG